MGTTNRRVLPRPFLAAAGWLGRIRPRPRHRQSLAHRARVPAAGVAWLSASPPSSAGLVWCARQTWDDRHERALLGMAGWRSLITDVQLISVTRRQPSPTLCSRRRPSRSRPARDWCVLVSVILYLLNSVRHMCATQVNYLLDFS
jgi:hypothetical protein